MTMLTTLILSSQLAFTPVPKGTPATSPNEQQFLLAPYDATRKAPEKKEPFVFPLHSKYFIRMDELCTTSCSSGKQKNTFSSSYLGFKNPCQEYRFTYLSRFQSLRISRENNNHSWKPKEKPMQ